MKKVFLCAMLVCAVLFASCNGVANGGDGLDANDPTVDRTPPAQFVETDASYIKFNNANVNLGYKEKVILKTLTNVKPEDEFRIRFVVDYEGKGQSNRDGSPIYPPANANNWEDAFYLDGTTDANDKGKTLTITLYIDGEKTDKKCTVTIAQSGIGISNASGSNGGGATGGSGNPSGGSDSGSGSGNSGYVLPPKTTPNEKPLVGIFSLDDRAGESGNWHVFIFGSDGTFRYSACTGHDGAYQKAHGGYAAYGTSYQVAGTYSVPGYNASKSRQITFTETSAKKLTRAVSPQMVAWEDWNGDKGFYLTYTREKIQTKRIFMRDSVLENKYKDWY